MEFLDPKKQRQHHLYLMICYGLMSIGLVLATVILLSFAYGFGVDRSGQLTQNGLIFASSEPSGATVYVNNQQQNAKTNTRLLLEAGRYTLRYEKAGYRSWQRSVVVNGGVVDRYDYAWLIPKDLKTTTVKAFEGEVPFASQSRDRRWLLIQQPANANEFLLYDLKNPKNAPVAIDVPTAILSGEPATQKWEQVEWSTDNRHVLLKRTYEITAGQTAIEYILLDRQSPEESVNVSTTLGSEQFPLQLIDGQYDQFYELNTLLGSLNKLSLKSPSPQVVVDGVQSYKAYGKDRILYVAASDVTEKTAPLRLKQGDQTYTLGTLPNRGTYLLDMARHGNKWYIAAGERSQNRVAVYKNPIDSLQQLPNQPLVPVQVLKVQAPVYMAFSATTRFVTAMNTQDFYTYDIEDDKGYQYTAKLPLDAPQTSARWVDGYHLAYVSGGKLVVFDYDNTNQQILQASDSRFLPFFSQDYTYAYSLGRASSEGSEAVHSLLQSTALRIEADL